MKILIMGWLVLLVISIGAHFFVFETLERDYLNIKKVYQADENSKVIKFLQESHYIISPKIEHYIGSSSTKLITPRQICDSVNITKNRLSQVPTFSRLGKFFETKLENNSVEALAICNNPANFANNENFFKAIAPTYLMQQNHLYWMQSFAISKRTYSGKIHKNMRYWIEHTIGTILLLGMMLCYFFWKKE